MEIKLSTAYNLWNFSESNRVESEKDLLFLWGNRESPQYPGGSRDMKDSPFNIHYNKAYRINII